MAWGSPVAEALGLGGPTLPPSGGHFHIYGHVVDSGCWLGGPSSHSVPQLTPDPLPSTPRAFCASGINTCQSLQQAFHLKQKL